MQQAVIVSPSGYNSAFDTLLSDGWQVISVTANHVSSGSSSYRVGDWLVVLYKEECQN